VTDRLLVRAREVRDVCWLLESAQLWSYPTFLLAPLMVVACIECVAGVSAWRFLLGLNGVVLGFVGGAILAVFCGAPAMLFIAAFAGAVAGGFLFAGAVRMGSFVFAFGSATSLTMILARGSAVPPNSVFPLAAAAGLAGAIAAAAGRSPFIIALTALAGAQQAVTAWHAYLLPAGSAPPTTHVPSDPAAVIALAASGALVKSGTFRLLRHPTPNKNACDPITPQAIKMSG
jgi:hypothetical protein